MYETEANGARESSEQIPAEILAQFQELKDTLVERTVLPWSEHCTECVWPTCYTTCDLYSPREDGRCRRFSEGMVRIDCDEAVNSYLLKIQFKRWGKLWTPGNIRLRSTRDALQLERRDRWIGTTLYQISLPTPVKKLAIQKRYSFKKRMAKQQGICETPPTAFVLECYNPSSKTVRLSLTMRAVDDRIRIPFQQLIELSSGFHRIRIGYEAIQRFLDLSSPFTIELVPNEDETETTTLYFGVMEFVHEAPTLPRSTTDERKPKEPKKIKCIVWDLDKTLWEGILVEDGPAKVRLKPEVANILKQLDERGILHSIASKNNPDEALAVLSTLGIEDYFLCPQISWQPKSQAIAAIAQQLNIGKDTLLFVDDSEFELQEVQTVHADVRVVNADRYLEIADMDICDVPVTEESRDRRKMYQVESKRQNTAGQFGDDYMEFLRYCDIRLKIQPMTETNLPRVHELTQRTNQMNFSGNRYEKSVLEQILHTVCLDTYVLEVEDRFGSYGVVGFCIVDRRVPLMTDLMFSCRVQSKRVEHAFLAHIIQKYIALTGKDFNVNYRKTPRNAPSGKVFSDMFLREVGIEDGLSRLVFPHDQPVPDDRTIEVVAVDAMAVVQS
jgi:FkbH-like protein